MIQEGAPGEGFARVDYLRWNAFHEGLDLISQVEAYRQRTGQYPEKLLADRLYGTRDNRRYLKQKKSHFAAKSRSVARSVLRKKTANK